MALSPAKRAANARKTAVYARLFPQKLRKGETTKIRMIEAAIEVMAKGGVEALSFESVGRVVGMNRAQIRYHFPDKEDLIDMAVRYTVFSAQTYVVSKLRHSKNWREEILTLMDGFFEWSEKNPNYGKMFIHFYSLASHAPRQREFFNETVALGVKRLEAILEDAKKELNRDSAELSKLALSIWALTDGLLIYYFTTDVYEPRSTFRKTMRYCVERLLA